MVEATKTAYVSPPNGQLDITLIRDANPRALINLDLGIPNFTVFSMTLPLAEGQPKAMSGLIAESVHVLLDEVATFMMSMEYDEKVIVNIYAIVLAAFKGMSTEADTSKEQDASGQDPTVKTFEGTFEIPMDFINETQRRVVTAADITEKDALKLRSLAHKLVSDPQRNGLKNKAHESESREDAKALHEYQWPKIVHLYKRVKDHLSSGMGFEFETERNRGHEYIARDKFAYVTSSIKDVEDCLRSGSDEFYPFMIAMEGTIIHDLATVSIGLFNSVHVPEWQRSTAALDDTAKLVDKTYERMLRIHKNPEYATEHDPKKFYEYLASQLPKIRKVCGELLAGQQPEMFAQTSEKFYTLKHRRDKLEYGNKCLELASSGAEKQSYDTAYLYAQQAFDAYYFIISTLQIDLHTDTLLHDLSEDDEGIHVAAADPALHKQSENVYRQVQKLYSDPKRKELISKSRESTSNEDARAAHEYQYPRMQRLYQKLLELAPRNTSFEFEDDLARRYGFVINSKMDYITKCFEEIDKQLSGYYIAIKPTEIFHFVAMTEDSMIDHMASVGHALTVETAPPSSWQTAATKIKRQPPVRRIELTYSPKEKIKPSDTARVIRMYRNRSLKQQPRPMYVIVYNQLGRPTGTIPIGPGKNFKNDLLRKMKKGSIDFSAPVSFVNEEELHAAPLNGIPRAISVGGMTYQPEAMSGGDMALYHGPQDYIVKFVDGRSQIFPGRPTFRKMRLLNFPVPRNRFRWTSIPEEVLAQPKAPEEVKEAAIEESPFNPKAHAEEVGNLKKTYEADRQRAKELRSQAGSIRRGPKRTSLVEQADALDKKADEGEAAWREKLMEPTPGPRSADQIKNDEARGTVMPDPSTYTKPDDTVRADMVERRSGDVVYLKPTKTFDDLVPLETLKKRLVRDELEGKPILEGLMVIDRVGHYGTFEGENVIVIPQYYVRRYGVQRDDGTFSVYHLRGDGKAQRVGFHPLKVEEFHDTKPIGTSIEGKNT